MRYDQLVCASCSGRVADGRCAVCRANREQLMGRRTLLFGVDWQRVLLPVLAALAALACLLAYYTRLA